MCPFVDQGDGRCAAHLTMKNLDSAFEHCADRFSACPIFQELLVNEHECDQVEQAPAVLAVA